MIVQMTGAPKAGHKLIYTAVELIIIKASRRNVEEMSLHSAYHKVILLPGLLFTVHKK